MRKLLRRCIAAAIHSRPQIAGYRQSLAGPQVLPLRLVNLRIAIAGNLLIPLLNLDVAPGEIATILGPSGSGKSTLLALIAGLIDPAFIVQGQIWACGFEVTTLPPEHRGVGLLFQDDLLFPHLTVSENLAFGLTRRVHGRRERAALVDASLVRAGLTGFGNRDPATLSGGQRQRVALFRTLLAEPRALLLDEPFNKLDAALRHELRTFVFHHVRDHKLPTLLVTHNPEDARAAGGAIVDFSHAMTVQTPINVQREHASRLIESSNLSGT